MVSESISFYLRNGAYVLQRIDNSGEKYELVLSESNVLFLPRILQETVHKIIEKRSNQAMKVIGASPVVAVPVSNIELNNEVEKSEILLTMRDKFGNESSFAISNDMAKPLAHSILDRVEDQQGN